jgi:hypothetical protein
VVVCVVCHKVILGSLLVVGHLCGSPRLSIRLLAVNRTGVQICCRFRFGQFVIS